MKSHTKKKRSAQKVHKTYQTSFGRRRAYDITERRRGSELKGSQIFPYFLKLFSTIFPSLLPQYQFSFLQNRRRHIGHNQQEFCHICTTCITKTKTSKPLLVVLTMDICCYIAPCSCPCRARRRWPISCCSQPSVTHLRLLTVPMMMQNN